MSQFKKGEDDFHWPFYIACITKIYTRNQRQNQYILSSCFSRCQCVPERLMHKKHMGIAGSDVRVK